jgi:hypothetical protein
VDINPVTPSEFVVGGDEEYAYVYDVRYLGRSAATHRQGRPVVLPVSRFCPTHMQTSRGRSDTHITSACFSETGEILATYSNEEIYLFHPWLRGHRAKARPDVSADCLALRRDGSVAAVGLRACFCSHQAGLVLL